ncbi:endonuclease/exonuclease/phosphatase family protein [Croceibacterium ferulae]|uniref:endonuclease/exonuclease/phosphatase family protein n=1 Tax=Croceibacterium ferulae TaxID=1854641 RepID=UPI000EAF2DED|nr:endonuclease/exonuclease/phosphatase family protein [Croceibacterium ferulae]
MRLTFASYNIHKGVGRDRRRDPERILTVLHEIGADVVALQEADRRYGQRETVLERSLLDEHHWQVVPVARRPLSMGWHGNALLVRRGITVEGGEALVLPTLEPRGCILGRLEWEGHRFQVAGMHLDLSGLLRRKQIVAACAAADAGNLPTVMMGDLNEWSPRKGALTAFGAGWQVLDCGRSFPSGRPLAALDRIVHSTHWDCAGMRVHHSAASAVASDHLPVVAELELRGG